MKKYAISQFGLLTGATKRTLHYYDQIGLLKPKKQANGYRQYDDNDLLILQQITTFKYLGLSIAKIKAILKSSTSSVEVILEKQADVLKSKACVLTKVAALIDDIAFLKKQTQKIEWSLITSAIQGLQKNTEADWFSCFYTKAEFSTLQKIWSGYTEEQTAHYIAEIAPIIEGLNKNCHLSPSDSLSKALAERLYKMLKECYGDYPILNKILITYRVGVFISDYVPPLKEKAYHYLIRSLKEIGKLDEIIT